MREVGPEHEAVGREHVEDRATTFSSGYGATRKCRRNTSLGRSPSFPCRDSLPIMKPWSILRIAYGAHTAPCSMMPTRSFGKRVKRLWKIIAATVSMIGRSPQYANHWNASNPSK